MSKSIRTGVQTKETMEFVAMVISQVFNSTQSSKTVLTGMLLKQMDELLERMETYAGKLHDIEVTMEKSSQDVQGKHQNARR